jgi:probable HAF family extracellular repeat protein
MRLAVSAAGFAAAFCLSNLSFATPPTTYRLTEIGAQDPPEQTTQLSTINILGETVVTVSVNGTAHAYVWRAGQQVPINIPDSVCGAGARVYGTGINNLEQVSATVVGTTPSGGLCYKTVIWHSGKVIAILNPPANVTSLPGGLLNDFRQVIGTAYTVDGGEPPFVWRNGHTTILPVLPGAAPSGSGGANAYFINDLGAIAGTSGSTDSPHAVVWRNGNITDLGVCPGWKAAPRPALTTSVKSLEIAILTTIRRCSGVPAK